MPPLRAEQLAQFEEQGYVLVDIDCTPEWLDDAEAAWDRLSAAELAGTHSVAARKDKERLASDDGYLALISHPFFEEVAKQVLRSDRVHIIEDGPHVRPPRQPGDAPAAEFDADRHWERGCHLDWQVSESNFTATPRRDLLAIWMWLNDVPESRAAMRVLPASHRPIMRHWENVLQVRA